MAGGRCMRNRVIWPIALVLLGITLVVYCPVLSHSFLEYDDNVYVTANPVVQRGLTVDGWCWAWTTLYFENWHPLTWLSHMLDCQLFGLSPVGHHLTNLLFHLANTLLVFLVLRRMTGATWRAALVAALFALHPLHVESVAWVAERKDVLSTFFGLLALGAYARYVERPGPLWYGLLLASFALSLLAKAMLVTLPAVLLLLDYWPLRRFPARGGPLGAPEAAGRPTPVLRLLVEKAPLLALSAAFCVVALLAKPEATAVTLTRSPLDGRVANALTAYAAYLRKMVWPSDLAVSYPHAGAHWSWPPVLAAALVLGSLTALAVGLRRRRPALLVGWLWYLGTLVPVIGLLQFNLQSMADRYTYFPLIGIFLALAWGVPEHWATQTRPRVWLAVGAGAALAACAAFTVFQIPTWQDDETLWRHALRVTENNSWAEFELGTYLYNHGRREEGEARLRRAVRLDADDAPALQNLGLVFLDQGKVEDALGLFTRATAAAPKVGLYQNSKGLALVRQGKMDEAQHAFEEAIRLAPELTEPYFNRAATLSEQGSYAAAAASYAEGLRRNPDWPWWAYDRAGKVLHEHDPLYRSPAEALWRARQADAATAGRYPEIQALLAEAYAANGRMTEAAVAARRALASTPAGADSGFVQGLLAALHRYERTARQADAPATP